MKIKNALKDFATWCYMNGISFSYMVNKKDNITGEEYIQNILKKYYDSKPKEDENPVSQDKNEEIICYCFKESVNDSERRYLTEDEYRNYLELKERDTPKKKLICSKFNRAFKLNVYCPVCHYVVDNAVPSQKFCDRCGQRLK